MLEASFTGLLRTIFIIIGVIAVLQFLSRFMKARREAEHLKTLEKEKEEFQKEKIKAEKEKGKISIRKPGDKSKDETVDVDFDDID